MPEIILRFNRVTPDADDDIAIPFQVVFDGQTTELADFKNPLTVKDLSEIRWYLEQYFLWPSDIDMERAHQIEGQLPKWGRQLFDAVFEKTPQAGRLFERFDDRRGDNNIISSSRKSLNMVNLALSKETKSHIQAHNQDYPNNSFRASAKHICAGGSQEPTAGFEEHAHHLILTHFQL